MEVFVTEEEPRFLEHLLINGELDVAIMVSNALSEPQALVAETLTRSPNSVWLAANHPLGEKAEVTLGDCAACHQIVLEADRVDDLMRGVWSRHQLKPRAILRTTSAGGGVLTGRRRRRHRRAAGLPVPPVDAGRRARGCAPGARRAADRRRRPGMAARLRPEAGSLRVHRTGASVVAPAAQLIGGASARQNAAFVATQ